MNTKQHYAGELDRATDPSPSILAEMSARLESVSLEADGAAHILSSFRSTVLGEIDPPTPTGEKSNAVRAVESSVVRLNQIIDRLVGQISDLHRQAQSIRQLG